MPFYATEFFFTNLSIKMKKKEMPFYATEFFFYEPKHKNEKNIQAKITKLSSIF